MRFPSMFGMACSKTTFTCSAFCASPDEAPSAITVNTRVCIALLISFTVPFLICVALMVTQVLENNLIEGTLPLKTSPFLEGIV